MNNAFEAQKIKNTILQANEILLVIHPQPDPDALGSLIAISDWLDSLDKKYTAYSKGTSLAECPFINETRQLIDTSEKLPVNTFDTVLVMDCGDLKYAGLINWLATSTRQPFIINIDHHASNTYFGHSNIVETTAASTTEILCEFFNAVDYKFSSRVASALLAGLISDTYGFTNPNTSARSLEISAALLHAGAKLPKVTDAILKNKSVTDLQLWGTILTRLNHNPNLNIATTIIADTDIANHHESEVTEGIANFLNNLAGVDMAMVLKQETQTTIKGSLRTNSNAIDVSRLAKYLGGGGHKKAAGFRVNGRLVKTEAGDWQII